jgi:hypothetical protein
MRPLLKLPRIIDPCHSPYDFSSFTRFSVDNAKNDLGVVISDIGTSNTFSYFGGGFRQWIPGAPASERIIKIALSCDGLTQVREPALLNLASSTWLTDTNILVIEPDEIALWNQGRDVTQLDRTYVKIEAIVDSTVEFTTWPSYLDPADDPKLLGTLATTIEHQNQETRMILVFQNTPNAGPIFCYVRPDLYQSFADRDEPMIRDILMSAQLRRPGSPVDHDMASLAGSIKAAYSPIWMIKVSSAGIDAYRHGQRDFGFDVEQYVRQIMCMLD